MKVAIFGLGLMGGSLARDLAGLGHHVRGADTDEAAVDAALAEHVINARGSPDGDGVADADVVVLAVPVQATSSLLARLAPHLAHARLIMDLGSTKSGVMTAASDAGLADRFIGAHPMTGRERSGWHASRPGLFANAPVYLCPPEQHPTVARDREACDRTLRMAVEFWHQLGAVPEVTTAAAHDRRVAWTSHLPQLMATGLAHVLRDAGYSRSELGPGGSDMTRLAGSDPRMWTGIACENAGEIVPALDAIIAALEGLRAAVNSRRSEVLHPAFDAARQWVIESPPQEP